MEKIITEDSICDSNSTDSQLSHADCCMSGNESSLSSQSDFMDVCRDRKTNYRSTQSSYSPYQPPLGLPSGYNPQTPFPSQTEVCLSTLDPHNRDHLHSSSVGSSSVEYPSRNLPSCLVSGNYCSYPSDSSYSCSPDRQSLGEGSLEQPRSLRSIPTAFAPHSYGMPPHPCVSRGPPCCSQYPVDMYQMDQGSHYRPHYHMPCWPSRKSRFFIQMNLVSQFLSFTWNLLITWWIIPTFMSLLSLNLPHTVCDESFISFFFINLTGNLFSLFQPD